MVFFAFNDNHSKDQPLDKGSYVRTWGIYRVDIQTIETETGARIQQAHNIDPVTSSTWIDPPASATGPTGPTAIALAKRIYNRRTKYKSKHQGAFDMTAFLNYHNIPLHMTDTRNDLIFRTEYPDIQVSTLPGIAQFVGGRSYIFTIKAGGYTNNVDFLINNTIPYSGDDIFLSSLKFVNLNSIKVAGVATRDLNNLRFDVIDINSPATTIGTITNAFISRGYISIVVPITGYVVPPPGPTGPTGPSDGVPIVDASTGARFAVVMPAIVPAVALSRFEYGKSYAVRVSYTGGPTFITEPVTFETQIASFGYGGYDKVKLDILWFETETRKLEDIPLAELPLESTLNTGVATATPSFFANIDSADVSLYKYTGTFNTAVANRLAPSIINYEVDPTIDGNTSTVFTIEDPQEDIDNYDTTSYSLSNYYGTNIFMKVLYKSTVPAKRLVGSVMSKTTVNQSLTLVGTVNKQIQFEDPVISNAYINIAQTLIFGVLTINNEDGPDFKYAGIDFTAIVPKLLDSSDNVISSTTLVGGRYTLTSTSLNLINNTQYKIAFYARRIISGGAAFDVLIVSSSYRYLDYSDISFTLVFIDDQHLKVIASFPAYSTKQRIKLELYGSNTSDILGQQISLTSQCTSPAFFISKGSTQQIIELKDPFKFKIGNYYSVNTTIYAYDDGTYSDTVVARTPTINSYANRFIYSNCDISTETNIYSGVLTVTIVFLTYLGSNISAKINIVSDQDVTYVRKNITLAATGNTSTSIIPITSADFIGSFTSFNPGDSYFVFLELGDDYTTPNVPFQYNPITLRVLSAASTTTGATTKVNSFELDWGGPAGPLPGKAYVVLKADGSEISPEIDVTTATLTCSFPGSYLTGNLYSFIVVYGTRILVSYDFYYAQITQNATNYKFIDDEGDAIGENLGYLTANLTLSGLPPHVSLKFELYEFDVAASQLDGVLITSNTVSHTPQSYSGVITFKTQYLRINKYYNVKYVGGDFFFPNNIIYSPKGYDIIVIAGASNQVGQDTDSTRGDIASYIIPRERGGYPQLTSEELTLPLIDKNNKVVKIYNLQAGGIYGISPLANEDIPSLHRAIAPFQQFSSNSTGSPYGITAGYEFAKYYASSNLLRSNRRVVVVNEAIPSSAFLLTPSGSTGLSWNATSGGYTGSYFTNIKNGIRSTSIRNTYSNIVPDNTKLTHANIGRSPKLGCKISLVDGSMAYSKQIVDNFQYCYFVEDTMLNSIHPNQGNVLVALPGTLSILDAGIRSYIQNELKSLNGTSVSGHTRFPFETGYTPTANEYNFDAFKNVMNFIVENELTLRINGLVGPGSTSWLGALSRSNAIYAIMRHCYTVVKWFNSNYPDTVFAYDVIRNHITGDAANAGVYNKAYATSSTDTLYAEAAFIGAYAALKATTSTSDLTWTESLVDEISIRFPYLRGDAEYGIDKHTILFQSTLQTILSAYARAWLDFPITGISIQGKYNIGDFILTPGDPFVSETGGTDNTIFTNTLFNGTTQFNQRDYLKDTRISLLRDNGDPRYIQGVTLLERIAAFSNNKYDLASGYVAFQKNLPVTITETQLNVSNARLGSALPRTAAYWNGATYPEFRRFQLQYLKTLYWLINTTDLNNVNKSYIGFGELVSDPGSQNLSSFFFSEGSLYTTSDTTVLGDFIPFIRTYPSTNSQYTANRVVAFLWNQGEANRPAFDTNATYESYLTSLINGLVGNNDIKSARLDDTVYLIGNLSYEHTAREMIKASATVTSYGIHDNADNFSILSRNVQPITSLGLHCIDPNIPTTVNAGGQFFPTISFSARSQRLLGARYFNGYLANTGNTSGTSYPIYRVETSSSSIPIEYDLDLKTKILTFINKATSYDYTKHPVGYIIQTRFYKPAGGFDSPDTDRYAIITEYSSTNKATTIDTTSPTLAIIPYFDMSSSNIVFDNNSILLNTYSVTGDTVSSKINSINNVIKASYVYDKPEVFTRDSVGNINGINTKTLSSDLTSYLDTVSSDYTANSYNGSISIVGTVVRNVLGGGPAFSIRYGSYSRVPPYSFVETPKIDTITAISATTVEISEDGSGFMPLATSNYVPNVVRFTYANGIMYAGHVPNAVTSTGTSQVTLATFPVADPQVSLTSSTTSTNVTRTAFGRDIQGTNRVGLTVSALAGIFTSEGTWGAAGASSSAGGDYTVTGNGRLYTIAKKGLDWIMFISRARFYTQRIIKNTTNYNILGTLASSIPTINTLNPPFSYPCATVGSQFSGISRIPLSGNNKLLPISGVYTPTFNHFLYLFNAETSIIFRLNNLTDATYTLSFYFSVKRERVPHESGYTLASGSTLITTQKIDTGATATDYPALYEIYDPLPINIFYSDPTTGASRTPNFTYNLRFNRGTTTANTLYLHGNSKWDGSWRRVSLTFTIPGGTTLLNGNCYVQLGPLPYRNMIDTSFNFGGFETNIVNTV